MNCINLNAQVQQQIFYTDSAEFASLLDHDSHGDPIIGGATLYGDSTNWNSFLIKCDSVGQIIWHRVIGASGEYEILSSLVTTIDGGVLGIFTSYTSVPFNAVVFKLDSIGNLEWSTQFDSVYQTFDLIRTAGNNYAFAYVGVFGFGLAEIDADGNLLRSMSVSASTFYPVEDLVLTQTSDNGFILCGTGSNNDIFIICFNSSGNVNWTKRIVSPGYEYVRDVIHCKDSTILLLATNMDAPNAYNFLIKITESGDTLWAKSYRSTPLGLDYYPNGLNLDSLGNIYFASHGLVAGIYSYSDVIKLDTSGAVLWSYRIGDGNDHVPQDLYVHDSGIDMVGSAVNYNIDSSGLDHAYLFRLDPQGYTNCMQSSIAFYTSNFTFILDTCEYTTSVHSLALDSSNYSMLITNGFSSQITCSAVTSENIRNNELEITVEPNPFSQRTLIFFNDNLQRSYQVEVRNLIGELVYSSSGFSNSIEIDLSAYDCGVYIFRVSSDDTEYAAGKFYKINSDQ